MFICRMQNVYLVYTFAVLPKKNRVIKNKLVSQKIKLYHRIMVRGQEKLSSSHDFFLIGIRKKD